MTEEEKAYLAGFIDGEGSIMLSGRKGGGWSAGSGKVYYGLRIIVTQTNLAILEVMRKMTTLGTIVKGHAATDVRACSFQWRLDHYDAIALLEQIRPYLILKKPQAELALYFADFKAKQQPKRKKRGAVAPLYDYRLFEAFKTRMHALNKRGPRPAGPKQPAGSGA